MAALQEALIASEERRLGVSRALLDFKMEHNEALESNERIQYDLTEKILELEARLAQSAVNKVRARLCADHITLLLCTLSWLPLCPRSH